MTRDRIKPYLIEGGEHQDERGRITFVNDFTFEKVNRFYIIENRDTDFIRAWQGHPTEHKMFFVIRGSFEIAWVEIDNWQDPSPSLLAESVVMTEETSQVLVIPPGHANGLKALENNSKMMVFSEFRLEQSVDEKIRFPSHWWKTDWLTIS